jgi:hypothetical protein
MRLNGMGFSDNDIHILEENGLNSVNLIEGSLRQINPQTGNTFTPQEIMESLQQVEELNEDYNQGQDYNNDTTQTSFTPNSDSTYAVGGKRKTKSRKNKKSRKSMYKIKGGTAVYGNGYGSNCNDPNYNIYNTNLLKLFPYSAK